MRDTRPLLWEVRGAAGRATLFGTYHAAGADDVPAAAWDRLAAADLFVAEADEVYVGDRYDSELEWEEAYRLPRGQSLRGMLTEDDYAQLHYYLDARMGSLNWIKPWVAMFQLARVKYAFPTPNISFALVDRARGLGKPTEFFETWPEQVAFLDASVGAVQLTAAIRNARGIRCEIDAGVRAYRAGDYAPLAPPLRDGDPIIARLDAWQSVVERHLTEGRHAFVAVGIAHLVGPGGLIARIEARGYRVERVSR